MERTTLLTLGATLLASAGITAALLHFGGAGELPLVDVPTGTPASPATPPPGALNVVVVVACSARQDEVVPYGGFATVTPYLAGLAEQSTVFADPVSASPWTRPAIAGLLTGELPRSLHMEEPSERPNRRPLPAAAVTLAERFHAAGWRTLGLSANPNVSAAFGFAQGFTRWVEAGAGRADRVGGATAVARSLALVDDLAPGEPMYLQVLLADAHGPYDVREGEARAYAKLDRAGPEVARYRVFLNRLDRALYALEQGLAERGYDATNTLLVVVSDHGEGLGHPAGQGRGHGRSLSPASVRAVWMVRGPGIPADRHVSGVASTLDVAPTVAGLAGLPAPEGAPAEGRDWAALVRSGGGATGRAAAWTETTWGRVDRAAIYTDEYVCQRDFAPASADGKNRFAEGCCTRGLDRACREFEPHPEMEARIGAWRDALVAGLGPAADPDVALDPSLAALVDAYGYAEADRAGKGE